MSLEQTLDSSNNTNIATNHNAAGWSTAQKFTMDIQHADRNNKKAEIEYSNAINQQNLSNHSALDELNANRFMNRLVMGAIANKLLNLEPEDSVAIDALFQGKANSSILSILSQLSGSGIGTKTMQTTPPVMPETGVTQLFAQLNALNSQNQQNQSASMALSAAMTALAGIINKTHYNTPPVGTTPIERPVQI